MQLTIFVPSYNRAAYLKEMYNSLIKQENQDFVWLIVDDGSSDDTREVVQALKEGSHRFEIEYVYQDNQGKPFAFNRGVAEAKTKYFLELDSDAWLADTAVKDIMTTIHALEGTRECVGYAFQYLTSDNKLITKKPFPSSPWYGDYDTMMFTEKIVGDVCFVFDTEVLKKFPYPKYNEEKFVSEAFLYNRLNHFAGVFAYINIPVAYHEYLPDGFTHNMRPLYQNNPMGHYVYAKEFLEFFPHGIYQTVRHIAAFGVFGKAVGKRPREVRADLKKRSHRIMYTLMLPAIYLYKL
jgi:glycosyltransferase involved in cell wall biosynthesis